MQRLKTCINTCKIHLFKYLAVEMRLEFNYEITQGVINNFARVLCLWYRILPNLTQWCESHNGIVYVINLYCFTIL